MRVRYLPNTAGLKHAVSGLHPLHPRTDLKTSPDRGGPHVPEASALQIRRAMLDFDPSTPMLARDGNGCVRALRSTPGRSCA